MSSVKRRFLLDGAMGDKMIDTSIFAIKVQGLCIHHHGLVQDIAIIVTDALLRLVIIIELTKVQHGYFDLWLLDLRWERLLEFGQLIFLLSNLILLVL